MFLASIPYRVFENRLFIHFQTSLLQSGLYRRLSYKSGTDYTNPSDIHDECIDTIIKNKEVNFRKVCLNDSSFYQWSLKLA